MKLIQKCTTNPVLSTTQAFKETLRQTGYDAIDRVVDALQIGAANTQVRSFEMSWKNMGLLQACPEKATVMIMRTQSLFSPH